MAVYFLLVTAFIYFKRAGLREEEYTERSFWLAIYLANDQEEDEDRTKWELLPWALGESWMTSCSSFMVDKDALWRRMGYRSLVSERQCRQVMALSPRGQAWSRVCSPDHGGALRICEDEEPYMLRGPLLPNPGCTRCPPVATEESGSQQLCGEVGTESEEEFEMFSLI